MKLCSDSVCRLERHKVTTVSYTSGIGVVPELAISTLKSRFRDEVLTRSGVVQETLFVPRQRTVGAFMSSSLDIRSTLCLEMPHSMLRW